ncbi:hypothetical protein [Polaromonas jejuensis]|uniref:Uncharacterized protein n=1 Tax=Polaromonas jejuensis TaxID=457502 RepID=A0ABW0Q4R0_9BURK|nr:hypothetical protein [Polaromonas jejuensis]
MKITVKPLLLASLVALGGATALWAGAAQAAAPYVSATVEGALAPGVYGRIDIGNAPPPPLIYAQPVIIQRAPVLVQQPPLYLHVPPGHAKNWAKHCARYNACGQPVYFVRVKGDDDYERRGGRDRHRGDDDDDHERGHGRGHDRDDHGRGHNRDERGGGRRD